MRVLITGGSGFIGTNLIPLLKARHELLSVDPRPPRNPELAPFWREADVRDESRMVEILREFQPERIVHLGARTDLNGNSASAYSSNTDGVLTLIRSIRTAETPVHTLYASSRLVFEMGHCPRHDWDYKPSTAYGESKVVGEGIVRQFGSSAGSWTILRPTSIWGPWFDTPYRDFFDMVASGKYVKFAGRDPLKSFGYVGNVVHQIARFLLCDPGSIDKQVFWLTDYEPLRLSEWADKVAEALGRPRPRYAPWRLAQAAARAGDLVTRSGRSFPLTTFRLNNLVSDMVYDASTTRAVVGDIPYDLDTAVAETVLWYQNNRRR